MIERPRRVVLLIDYDNLQICASRDTPGRELQLTPVVQLAQRYGTVILARAYAEWNLSTERLAVYKAGIEPAFAPVLRTESDRSGKSLADTVMVAEGMDMLWTLSPDVVVLATSDKDLIPLVRVAKQRGAFVVVLGSDFTAIPLREMADDHLTYRQLITDASGRFATEAGPARQPAALPEPARRRTRDRSGRERATVAPTSNAVASSIPPRPERGERPDREAPPVAPAAAAVSAPSVPASGPAEPVAPVTATEADSQAAGRRRRRRGSRRRSERVGMGGEGAAGADIRPGEDYTRDQDGEAEYEPPEVTAAASAAPELPEITPTTSAADIAQASGGTVEMPSALEALRPAAEVSAYEAEPQAAPPAPRDRRRRTRRPGVAAESIALPTPPWPAHPAGGGPDEDPHPPAAAEAAGPAAGEASGPIESEPTPNGEDAATKPRTRRRATSAPRRSRATGR